MDCSICFEAITKATGSTTLSCEHVFHFRCIDNWFGKQVWDDLPQSCPCCRNEGTELDRCEVIQDDEDDEDYEEEEEEEEISLQDRIQRELSSDFLLERNHLTGQFLITPRDTLALQQVRSLFGPLNVLDEEEHPGVSSQEVAARKIQAFFRYNQSRVHAARKIQSIFRGNQVRNTYGAAMTLMRLLKN
jgi:hypothetical protein